MHLAQSFSTPLPALMPTPPTRLKSIVLKFLMLTFGGVARIALKKVVGEVQIHGIDHLKKGPALVLMNHTNPLDPLLLSCFGRQPIHFFITEPSMTKSFMARLMIFFGQITKRKLMNDTLPIRTMKKWADLGGLVAMFPEGQFSWDGDASPLQPGLHSLIQYLQLPVITIRLSGGQFMKPAWAKKIRRGKLFIEIDPPKKYAQCDEIEKDIAHRLKIQTAATLPLNFEKTPHDLSQGIATFFRFCPNCFKEGQLREESNELTCLACHARWNVTLDLQLDSINGRQASISIKHAWEKIKAHLQSLLQKKAIFQSLSPVAVYDCTHTEWKLLAQDTLEFRNETLFLQEWNLLKSDILAFTLDWGDLILIRTQRKRYALKMPGESRAIWEEVLRAI
jgi:1-acyl-sn-glycerol-3-phosphate acyltransferase